MDKKKEILEAAALLFRKKGYKGATMQDIASEVGLLKGSIYYYFETKEDILAQVVRQPLIETTAGLREIRDSRMPSLEKFRKGMMTHLGVYDFRYPSAFALLSEDYGSKSRMVNGAIISYLEEYERIWQDIIGQAAQDGVIDSRWNLKVLLFALLGMCNWMYKWYSPRGALTATEIAEQFAELFIRGIASYDR